MNVYDTAHNLANAIKESQEYKDYAALKEKIDANPELSGMMKDFESKQLDLQTRQMVGEEVYLRYCIFQLILGYAELMC